MKDFFKNKVSLGFLIFFLLFGLSQIFLGEKTAVRGGFFYDGSVYADITMHFEELVFHKGAGNDAFKPESEQFTHGISDYLLQRTLPLGLVHYSLKLFGAEFSNFNVVRAFEYWNLIYLMISIIAWHFIIRKLNLKPILQLFSYVLIFGNFAFLKLNFYYPVLTDTPAFMLMMLTLYAWLYQKPVLQLVILLMGAFTWPSFFYLSGVLLFFMPNQNDDLYEEKSWIKWWGTAGAALLAMVFLYWVFYIKHNNDGVMSYFEGEWDAEKINRTWLPLSLLLLMVYWCGLYFNLLKLNVSKVFNIRNYLKSYHIWMGILLLVLFVGIKFVIKQLQGPDTVSGMKLYIRNAFLRSCTDPLTFLVSNIQYFGLIFILLIFYARDFIRRVQSHGPGAVIVIAMIIVFSINSESRQITYIIPILVYFFMQVIRNWDLSMPKFIGLSAVAIALSKCWLPLNHGDYVNMPTSFPDQWYFMNMGPWMSHSSYLIFAGTALAATIFVWLLTRTKKINL